MSDDMLDPDTDPFKPPAIPTAVGCIHCGQEYESYLIEWRIETDADGSRHGFWCCPIPDCGGKGFGFDIFPLDPEYQSDRGGWVWSDDEDEDDELDDLSNGEDADLGVDADAEDRPGPEDGEEKVG